MITFQVAYRWLNRYSGSFISGTLSQQMGLFKDALAGREYGRARQLAESLMHITRSIGSDPERAETYVECARAYYLMGNLPEAALMLKEAITLYLPYTHQVAITFWMLGYVNWRMYKQDEAIIAWRNSLSEFEKFSASRLPDLAQMQWYEGICHRMRRSIEQAITNSGLPHPVKFDILDGLDKLMIRTLNDLIIATPPRVDFVTHVDRVWINNDPYQVNQLESGNHALQSLTERGEFFLTPVRDDGLCGAGIDDGDYVLICIPPEYKKGVPKTMSPASIFLDSLCKHSESELLAVAYLLDNQIAKIRWLKRKSSVFTFYTQPCDSKEALVEEKKFDLGLDIDKFFIFGTVVAILKPI